MEAEAEVPIVTPLIDMKVFAENLTSLTEPEEEPVDENEESYINPLDLLEVSPVDAICAAPDAADDENVKVIAFEPPPFKCEDCYVSFPDYSAFRYHVIIRHSKDPATLCDVCSIPCSSASTMAIHKIQKHEKEKKEATTNGNKSKDKKGKDKIVILKQGKAPVVMENASIKKSRAKNGKQVKKIVAKRGRPKRKKNESSEEEEEKDESDEEEEEKIENVSENSDEEFCPTNKDLSYVAKVEKTYNFRSRRSIKNPRDRFSPSPDDKSSKKSTPNKRLSYKEESSSEEEESSEEQEAEEQEEEVDEQEEEVEEQEEEEMEEQEQEVEEQEEEEEIEQEEEEVVEQEQTPPASQNLTPQKKEFDCEDCKTKFRSEKWLKNHKIKKHGYKPPEEEVLWKSYHKCENCGKEFKSLSVLKRHRPEQCTGEPDDEPLNLSNSKKRKY